MEPLVGVGAVATNSLRELAERCAVLVVSLPDLDSARHVMVSSADQFTKTRMRIVMNTCTTGLALAEEAAAALAVHDIARVECPISDGPAGARDGTLSIMVSGDPAAVTAVRPLLSLWGATVTIAGYRDRTLDTRLGSSNSESPSCGRAATFRPSWRPARPRRRPWWR